MSADGLSVWAGVELAELLALDTQAPMHFRNRLGDPNSHGRAFGGQVLAQSLMAASLSVPDGRPATAMQFMFLQGTQYDQPIDFHVTALQDGKRFSSRHVRGVQAGERTVFDVQVSFAVPIDGPDHMGPIEPLARAEDPTSMPGLGDLPTDLARHVQSVLGYLHDVRPVLDLRLPPSSARMRLELPAPRFRFWARVGHRLADDRHLHAAAFAYLSDWWFNYGAVGGHLDPLAAHAEKLYVASLNHALWLHRPFRADEWLHFDTWSPSASDGRGLAIGRAHDRSGRLVASVTQECLMASAAQSGNSSFCASARASGPS
ncbi:thioesterase family protein [Variovorax sp. J22P168]|uniref:acyl-CoA thioesterase n=1 Tax=Variovorax jilinensis TaxID=3053513 RepID=UPI002574CE88|nr:acyl-CoA thioesterase domain-containing protein [Variovorax sp. J22P168]MDM0015100.1 thioesterase family protein [Variovorax sp. J22P168]